MKSANVQALCLAICAQLTFITGPLLLLAFRSQAIKVLQCHGQLSLLASRSLSAGVAIEGKHSDRCLYMAASCPSPWRIGKKALQCSRKSALLRQVGACRLLIRSVLALYKKTTLGCGLGGISLRLPAVTESVTYRCLHDQITRLPSGDCRGTRWTATCRHPFLIGRWQVEVTPR